VKHALLVAALLCGHAAADEVPLRFASVAPDGTAWAHLLRDFGHNVERLSKNKVRIKWYFGGLAGDENEQLRRVRSGQLDGAAATVSCDELAPSLKVLHVLGLVQSPEEVFYLLGKLRPTLDAEMEKHGFMSLGYGNFGPSIFISRKPMNSMADLKAIRWWVWKSEPTLQVQLAALGIPFQAHDVWDGEKAFRKGEVDGFIAIPSAVLAWQWTPLVTGFLDLHAAYLGGCLYFARRAYDSQPLEVQQALRVAGLHLTDAFEKVNRDLDKAMLGGLFAKQGVKPVEPSSLFQLQFLQAARELREKLGDELVPHELMLKVQALLADYRAVQGQPRIAPPRR
jgi:TRAP-type C4-dicarboxylate transport system substrate-binding protein